MRALPFIADLKAQPKFGFSVDDRTDGSKMSRPQISSGIICDRFLPLSQIPEHRFAANIIIYVN